MELIRALIPLRAAAKRLSRLSQPLDNWWHETAGPIRVLFVVYTNYGFACQQPVLEALAKEPDFKVALTCHPEISDLSCLDGAQRDCFQKHRVTARAARWDKWHYVLHTQYADFFPLRDAVHVSMAHGCAFGWGGYSIDMACHPAINIVLGLCAAEGRAILRATPSAFDGGARVFFPVGFPKLDALLRREYSRERTLAELGLPADRKTVLIGSHWTPPSILRTWGARLLDNVARMKEGFNIIQTGHDYLWRNPSGNDMHPDAERADSARLWQELKRVEKRFHGVRVARAANILPLMNAADLFITDHSSTMVEFSVLDRPVLFFDNPLLKALDAQAHSLYRRASIPFVDLKGIEKKIQAALAEPAAQTQGRRRLREHFLEGYHGESSRRVIEILRGIGRVCGPASTRWARAAELSRLAKPGLPC